MKVHILPQWKKEGKCEREKGTKDRNPAGGSLLTVQTQSKRGQRSKKWNKTNVEKMKNKEGGIWSIKYAAIN